MTAQVPEPARRDVHVTHELRREDRPDHPPGDLQGARAARSQIDGELVADQQGEDDAEPGHHRVGAFERARQPLLERGFV